MAMFVDPLVSQLGETLAAALREEVGMLVGVRRELEWLERKMAGIRTVLEDAERKAFHDPTVRTWLADLKGVIYDADDIIDERRTHYESLARLRTDPSSLVRCYSTFFSCFRRVPLHHQAGSRIRRIKERLERILKDQSDLNLIAAAAAAPRDDHRGDGGRSTGRVDHRQTGPVLDPDIVGVGIESDTSNLVSLLTAGELRAPSSSSSSSNVVAPQVLAIVGMGGIGKTTLAQKLYNHPTIRDSFRTPPPMWVCVSQDYSETALLREVLRAFGGVDPGGHDRSLAELQGSLTQAIQGKKFLLILDDVWSRRVWEDLLRRPLQHGAAGSRILITTRQELVAKQMGAVNLHNVQLMSTNDGWALLCKTVFQSGEGIREMEETFRDTGMQIVQKCGHLPLAIKTVGGVLTTKEREPREWEKVLGNQAWLLTDHLPDGVMGALYLSYEDLPSHLKRCFIYCSLFPEDFVFMRPYIVQYWIAQGFVKEEGNMSMEEVGEEYYKDLIRRSLLQPDPRIYDNHGCKMHDLLRSLAQFLVHDEYFVGDVEGLAKATTASSSTKLLHHISIVDEHLNSFPDGVKDHKCLRTLFLWYLNDGDVPADVFLMLGRLRVLDFGRSKSSIIRLPESIGNLTHLRLLDLSFSSISELPETIGSLSNLRYLNLQHCVNLHNLPKGIVKLYNLRALYLFETRVTGFPVGIGRLQHLNKLIGFVATNESSIDGGRSRNRGRKPSPDDGWCSLEELTSLSKLRDLVIYSLEREALNRAGSRRGLLIPVLKDKTHLIELELYCAPCKSGGQPYGDEEAKQIQELFQEDLFPPPSLEQFQINGYFGLQFPSWMTTSGVASVLKNLRRLDLKNCQLCKKLPPLGLLLPNLDYLYIERVDAVQSIGPEFLGIGAAAAVERIPPFPKLDTLIVENMPNWVEWLWDFPKHGATVMPRLQSLVLINCPKLGSLPKGLCHATSLRNICIEGANNLDVIEDLVSVEDLSVEENPNLVRISNLPVLQELTVSACPTLREVEGLPLLKSLELTDLEMDILPDWLLPKEGGQQTCCFPALAKLNIVVGGVDVLRRCLKGAPDWPKIQHFPNVHIQAHGRPEFVSYNRDPFTFRTNLDGADTGRGI